MAEECFQFLLHGSFVERLRSEATVVTVPDVGACSRLFGAGSSVSRARITYTRQPITERAKRA
jgi:hypothetical protein